VLAHCRNFRNNLFRKKYGKGAEHMKIMRLPICRTWACRGYKYIIPTFTAGRFPLGGTNAYYIDN